MTEKLVLDLGCGSKSYIFHPYYDANVFVDVERPTKKIKNFIVADACHLPFQDNAFETIYCNHVLEHLADPVTGIKELIRTSKKHVIIKTPHRFSANAKADKTHKSFFNVRWFRKLLSRLNVFYEIEVSWAMRPRYFPILNLPNEITVKMWKKDS